MQPEIATSPSRAYVYRDRGVEPGAYVYRITEVAPDGRVSVVASAPIEVTRVVPVVTFLDPALPNPFNPSTSLRFGVATGGRAEIAIFDSRGRHVATLWRSEHAEPGYHRVVWNGRDDAGQRVASGIYHARLQTEDRTVTRRLNLVK